MPPFITTLIDKQDNSEIIRDQIAAIIAVESANQVTLATAASKPDPDDWKLRVFTEASNPWEQFRNFAPGVTDDSPLVNVWFDNVNFDRAKSDTFERQKADGVFNLDIYGVAVSSDDGGTGHTPGDRDASCEVQRGGKWGRKSFVCVRGPPVPYGPGRVLAVAGARQACADYRPTYTVPIIYTGTRSRDVRAPGASTGCSSSGPKKTLRLRGVLVRVCSHPGCVGAKCERTGGECNRSCKAPLESALIAH